MYFHNLPSLEQWKLVNEPTIPANRRLPWFQLHVSSAGSVLPVITEQMH